MCGICGTAGFADQRALERMVGLMTHRGPDDHGTFVAPGRRFGLGNCRLSIIDLSAAGHMPMSNEDGSVWISYNGEIYNFSSLRAELEAKGHCFRSHTDSEVLVHGYEEWGLNLLSRLNGMFALAVLDMRAQPGKLFLARDRFGIKPLYYTQLNDGLIFASEIKAILSVVGVPREVDLGSLHRYLAFLWVPGPETMFKNIYKLPPGHYLQWRDGQQSIHSYWDIRFESAPARKEGALAEELSEILERAVKRHLISDVPLGVFLSGGLDSSAVAALTTKIRKQPIETFSVGYGEEAYSELPHARTIATHLKSKHHEVQLSRGEFFQTLPRLIWHEDEPIVWPSSVALYFVARLARERVTVVLTGEGSDETLGGYTRYPWTLLNSRMDNVYRTLTPSVLRRLLRERINFVPLSASTKRKLEHTFLMRDGESWPSFYFDNFYSAFSASEQDELLTPEAARSAGDAYAGSMSHWNRSSGDLLHRLLYTDIKTYLVELLMKQDQMSMAASIESRVPFLDHVLVEFTATIPAKYSTNGMAGKSILKSAVADLLPEAIVHRQKMGFPTPWAYWLAGPQLEDLERVLLERRSLERGLFRAEVLKRLFAEHRAGHRDHGNRIWRLLNLELWLRVCVDGESAADLVQPGNAVAYR